jgi:hypothetical protein
VGRVSRLNHMKFEYDEALAWQRGINNRRIADGREPREPFYMSKATLRRIREEADKKAMTELLVQREINRQQKRAQLAYEEHRIAQQNEAIVAFHAQGILETVLCVTE